MLAAGELSLFAKKQEKVCVCKIFVLTCLSTVLIKKIFPNSSWVELLNNQFLDWDSQNQSFAER